MASKLEEFITFVETGRYQDAEKYREAAQEEYFKAKNRLGRHERKECESIDQVFSFIEKGLYREAKGMLSKAKASKEASEKLRKDNPNIADLSDTNRPTKIAEKFSELYDNEWTEAYIDLTQNQRLDERKVVTLLYDIVLTAYDFCRKEASDQIQQIQEAAISIVMHGHAKHSVPTTKQLDPYPLIQFRKDIAFSAVERLKRNLDRLQAFVESQNKQLSYVKHSRPLEIFVANSVEITWWMCVQNPPVHLQTEKLGPVNHDFYKPYTKSGKVVDYFIWPPILLHDNGPLLSKGIVQAK